MVTFLCYSLRMVAGDFLLVISSLNLAPSVHFLFGPRGYVNGVGLVASLCPESGSLRGASLSGSLLDRLPFGNFLLTKSGMCRLLLGSIRVKCFIFTEPVWLDPIIPRTKRKIEIAGTPPSLPFFIHVVTRSIRSWTADLPTDPLCRSSCSCLDNVC